MTIENRLSRFGIWLALSTLAALSCSVNWSAANVDGEYIPVGNDSFYHARRILDTARDPSAFYQFDTHINAPEGSLLVWPWGYDYAMGWIVRIGTELGISQNPMTILDWIPVAAVTLSVWLMLLVCRKLDLSLWATALAGLCVALAPTTQLLHGVGEIDHHYVEFIFVLATLACGLGWLRRPDAIRAAVALGLTLGIAPAIHNGLFILQVPLLVALFVLWVQGNRTPRKATAVFCATLLGSTLAVLLPSTAFRMGNFEFYTLSWFHLYIAACTTAAVAFFGWLPPTRNRIVLFIGTSIVLVLPVVHQIHLAHSFLTGSVSRLGTISEMASPWRRATTPGGPAVLSDVYSYLIWLAPVTSALCLAQCWRERALPRLFFWVSSICGLALLSMQLRMHYFGTFALYLPWLILVQDHARTRPTFSKKLFLLTSMALLLLYSPSLRHQLLMPMPLANDPAFESLRPMLLRLHDECSKDPGVVLADSNAGHYIRYYSDCSVITNNFLLTPQHFRKLDEADHLFSLPATKLLSAAPYVKYVLVRPLGVSRTVDGNLAYEPFSADSSRLATDLLFGPSAALPPAYVLLHEVRFPDPDLAGIPYARLYRIQVATAKQKPSSLNNAAK